MRKTDRAIPVPFGIAGRALRSVKSLLIAWDGLSSGKLADVFALPTGIGGQSGSFEHLFATSMNIFKCEREAIEACQPTK